MKPRFGILFILASAAATSGEAPFDAPASAARGAAIYQEKCALCHQATGQGVPDVFPPLAASDFLVKDRTRSLKALLEGMSGPITVNGAKYEGLMPAQVLDDAAVADVMNFIGTSWGNALPPFNPGDVAKVREKTGFKTYESLVAASAYAPLPKAPEGFALREVVRFGEADFGSRMTQYGGRVFVLMAKGDIWRLEPDSGKFERLFARQDYSEQGGDALGITAGPDGRLWITGNRKLEAKDGGYPISEGVIFRTPPPATDGTLAKPHLWFRATYPHGGGFNHGISHVAFGPDGKLYVSSGSRTDSGEKPKIHPDSPVGEVDNTACIWRLDPAAEQPALEIFARGLRNPYGFAWDKDGNLFAVVNGPDANAPEEMDHIVQGRHYGFPYQFSDWPLEPKPYPHTPPPPAGLVITHPVKNLGPAGGAGLATFDPHSSPAGIILARDDSPEAWRGKFLVVRYGNLLGEDRTKNAQDVGFDLLSMQLARDGEKWTAKTETILAPLARPIDVLQTAPGKILILEYTRPTDFKSRIGWMGGRILELRVK